MRAVTIPFVMALSIAMCGFAAAQDVVRGQALAERWCANCHVVNQTATTGRADGLTIGADLNGTLRITGQLIDGATGSVKRRGFVSKEGHMLVFLDDRSKSGVLLATANKGLRIALNDTETTIRVTSKGKVEIESGTDLTITAKGSLALKASTGIKIDGGPQVEIKGSVVKLN